MEGDRGIAALERIDAALARIAAVSARPGPEPAVSIDPILVQRHEALRASVEVTIADLDALISGLAR